MLLLDDTLAPRDAAGGRTLAALNSAYLAAAVSSAAAGDGDGRRAGQLGGTGLSAVEQLVLRLRPPRGAAALRRAYAAYQALYAQQGMLGYAHASWHCDLSSGAAPQCLELSLRRAQHGEGGE